MNNYMSIGKKITITLSILLIVCATIRYAILPVFVFPMKYKEEVLASSQQYNVDPLLIYSIIRAESDFDSNAVSNRGAKGLMQIMDKTGEWAASEISLAEFSKDQLFDPAINIRIGCWYIAKLINQYDGDVATALAAYNAGTGNVYKWKNNKKYSEDGVTINYIPFEETRNYINRVNRNLKFYRYLY
ncbi:MAG: lytic transglycosylase domain-containing protein [Epulopiscium sp.]|nr:lytic transglycosylase domain-containing protein [Candidatus Epulonipiscium sp.]